MESHAHAGRNQEDRGDGAPIRVLCVDDDPSTNELHRLFLGNQPDMQCAGTRSTTSGLVDEIERSRANVLLIDVRMPDSDPLGSIEEVRAAYPGIVILVTSGLDDPAVVEETLARGANGYFLKTTDLSEMLDGIRRAARGEKLTVTSRARYGAWGSSRL